MTREQAQSEREAFNAFCDGKEIQWRLIGDSRWFDCAGPVWEEKLEHRIKPQPKMVQLGPEDVPLGSWIRGVNVTEVMAAVISVWPHGIRYVDGSGLNATGWQDLVRSFEISRDGGKTWSRCEKEETK